MAGVSSQGRIATGTSPVDPRALERHVRRLRACRLCPKMHPPPVSGGPVASKVLLVGQAPGAKEPVLGRPFA
jgi:uracil-DNA glycosylase